MMKFLTKDIIKLFKVTLDVSKTDVDKDTFEALQARINDYATEISDIELDDLSLDLIGELEILGYISGELLKLKKGEDLQRIEDGEILAYANLATHYLKNKELFMETKKTVSI